MSRSINDYPVFQNLIEDVQSQIDALALKVGEGSSTIGPTGNLTCVGPEPVSIRAEKSKPVVTLKFAVPSGTQELHCTIEQYTQVGSVITVQRTIPGKMAITASQAASRGGLISLEFPERLDYNANSGLSS